VSLAAAQFANAIDLTGVRTCPLCLLDLAWKIREGERPHPSIVARTADWIWCESKDDFKRAVLRARMREVPGAEEALRDLEVNAWRGPYFRALVVHLAGELADELTC
jgi:hypothetical protein